jgi:hypothetical protein
MPIWKWLELAHVDLDKDISQRDNLAQTSGSDLSVNGTLPMARVTGVQFQVSVSLYNENLQPYGRAGNNKQACNIEVRFFVFPFCYCLTLATCSSRVYAPSSEVSHHGSALRCRIIPLFLRSSMLAYDVPPCAASPHSVLDSGANASVSAVGSAPPNGAVVGSGVRHFVHLPRRRCVRERRVHGLLARVDTHTHTHTQTHTHTHARARVHRHKYQPKDFPHTHSHERLYTDTYTHASTHLCTRAHTHTHMHM